MQLDLRVLESFPLDIGAWVNSYRPGCMLDGPGTLHSSSFGFGERI